MEITGLAEKSVVVIGDIHGCYKTFKKLLKQFPSDQICLVGDLVDRGPDSADVIQFVMDNHDRIKCVLGNHEKMMLDFYAQGGVPRFSCDWLGNGGKRVYEAYKYKHGSTKLTTHLDFLKSLPYYIEYPEIKNEEGQYLLVSHSVAINPNLDLCASSESLIWGRHFPEKDPSKGKWFNVFGHTPIQEPELTDWYCNIDTGCCFNASPGYGRLTALRFPDLELVITKNVDMGQDKEPDPTPTPPTEPFSDF